VLVTEGDSSTLVPVTLDVTDLEGMRVDDARRLIELFAERRFRSLPAEQIATAAP